MNNVDIINQENKISVLNEQNKLQFDGVFKGRENEIRITPDKQISVFDFIKVVGGQEKPKNVWYDIEKKYRNEVALFSGHFKFQGKGQKLTPVVNVQGMVKLLFWLPGETAKQFRSKSAEVMIRYLGGDTTLIDEIKAIDQEHLVNPNNISQIFREEVNNKLLFNQDLINISNKLINHFGNKTNIFYAFLFYYKDKLYSKYGLVGEVREFCKRVEEHITEFENICFFNILQCSNIDKVESDFKNSSLVSINKTKIPKKHGGNHTEIIQLSEIVTTETIKEEMIKVAGDRMLDPPPMYNQIENMNNINSLEIEKERTKQKELETKQKEMEINLELKKLEFQLEMRKLELNLQTTTKETTKEKSTKTVKFKSSAGGGTLIKKVKKVKVKSKAELAKIENEKKIIKEYLEAKTIKSKLCNDSISMKNLYKVYTDWIKLIYPNEDIIKQRVFTTRMKSTEIVNYSDKISNLKSTSGITNIKFK